MDQRRNHRPRRRWTQSDIERGIANGTLHHDGRHDWFTAIEGAKSQVSSQRFSKEIARYEKAVTEGASPRPKLRTVRISVERSPEDGPNILGLTHVVDLFLHFDEA